MAKNRSLDISLKLTNSGETQLGNLTYTTETASGITAEVINTESSIDAGKSKNITLRGQFGDSSGTPFTYVVYGLNITYYKE